MKYILLVSGKAQSGKNTFADFLTEGFKSKNMTVQQELFASGVKNGCKEDFQALTEYLNNYAERLKAQLGSFYDFNNKFNVQNAMLIGINNLVDKLKIDPNVNWFEQKTDITRIILQLYGTDIFRKRVDTDWWAKQLKDKIIGERDFREDITIITDCRFPNEIEVFNDLNPEEYKVITIRVERNIDSKKNMYEHLSETALDNWDSWNYIIENNDTIEKLKESAREVINDILTEKVQESTYLFADNVINQ